MDTKKTLNPNEAPDGYYAIPKDDVRTPNVCDSCEARHLCVDNQDNWALKNRCMSYEITAIQDNQTYSREDKCSVVFKKKSCQNCRFIYYGYKNSFTDEEDAICRNHKKTIDELFPILELNLSEIVCKQFEGK